MEPIVLHFIASAGEICCEPRIAYYLNGLTEELSLKYESKEVCAETFLKGRQPRAPSLSRVVACSV